MKKENGRYFSESEYGKRKSIRNECCEGISIACCQSSTEEEVAEAACRLSGYLKLQLRWRDKPVDELAKGKPITTILR